MSLGENRSGSLYRVAASHADLRREPDEESGLETQVLYGEQVLVREDAGNGWARVVAELDGYPGFMRVEALTPGVWEPTHRAAENGVAVFRRPDFKAPRTGLFLSFNSLVRFEDSRETPEGLMRLIPELGWVFEDRLRPLSQPAPDFVAEALKLQGLVYAWGARSLPGYDCSAFIQAGCIAAGIPCPRDCVPQSLGLGEPVETAGSIFSDLRRGDLVFWTEGKGRHVADMVDGYHCLHATTAEPHRKVLIQQLAEVAQDQARDGNGPVTAVRRIPGYGQ